MSGADLYGACGGCGVNVDPADHDCPNYDEATPEQITAHLAARREQEASIDRILATVEGKVYRSDEGDVLVAGSEEPWVIHVSSNGHTSELVAVEPDFDESDRTPSLEWQTGWTA